MTSSDHAQNDNTQFVKWAYDVLLGRAPDPEGETHWLNKLQNGMSKEELSLAIMYSEECATYQNRQRAFAREAPRWMTVKELGCDLLVPIRDSSSSPSVPSFILRVPARDLSVTQGLIDNHGIYERHVTHLLTGLLQYGDTFIDVGANLGYFTLLGARLVGDAGAVIAFEPVSLNRQYCQANLELNSVQNATLFAYGLWSKEKVMDITTSDIFHGGAHLGSVQPIEPAAMQELSTEQITCVSFDQLADVQSLPLGRLKAIKMDIEGAEPFALDGMSATIHAHRPLIVLEVNRVCLRSYFQLDSDAIWQRLASAGYSIAAFPEQCAAAVELPSCTSIEGVDLRLVPNLDTLNMLCPEDGLIDIVALP